MNECKDVHEIERILQTNKTNQPTRNTPKKKKEDE
jgi:hypothetical protein